MAKSLTTSQKYGGGPLGDGSHRACGASDGPLSKSRRVSVVWQSGSDHVLLHASVDHYIGNSCCGLTALGQQ